MKIKIFLFVLILFNYAAAYSASIASCSNPSGYEYFQYGGLVSKIDGGWRKGQITDGKITLELTKNGYDIMFVDATKNIISSVGDGAIVSLLYKNNTDSLFLLYYPKTGTLETYRFFEDAEGLKKYATHTSRSNSSLIPKSSLMVGNCDFIDFNSIKNIKQ